MNATIPNPINLLLLILGTYLGIKLSSFLLKKSATRSSENKYLGIFVGVQSLPIILGCLYRFDCLGYFSHLIGVQTLFHFLIGPLAYLYIRACTQKDFQFRPILWLHFLPFLMDACYNIPFFMRSGSEKFAFYEEFVQNGKLYSPPIFNLLKTIHSLVYFSLALYFIQQYRKYLPNAASSIDKGFHRWLLFFIIIVAFPILASIFYVSTAYDRSYTILTWLIGVVIFYISIDIVILLKPELFQTFPFQVPLPESTEVKKQKYESSKLQEDKKDQYLKKLKAFVQLEKPFQTPDLTLAQLSEKVKIPAHYVSQVINEKLDTNFLDFINAYRVKAAQEMLVDPKLSHYTILSIAYEAGFSAKSTFYAVFKKHTGMTPSQYRKQMVAEVG